MQAAVGEWSVQAVYCLPSTLLETLLLQGNSQSFLSAAFVSPASVITLLIG